MVLNSERDKLNSELGIRNSECGINLMRNYFCSASYRKIVGADFISACYNIVVLSHKNTVGDGSPVPRRKAFSDKFGIISVTQITARYFTINECPYFHRINPLKIGTFCYYSRFLTAFSYTEKSLRDSGRETRPLRTLRRNFENF